MIWTFEKKLVFNISRKKSIKINLQLTCYKILKLDFKDVFSN